MLQVLAERRPGCSLPRDFYVDPALYRADLELVWYREWIFVGHVAQLSGPGDYFTTAIGDASVIVLRDDEGVLKALHNVCRHRGSILCDEASGTLRRRIVCPYHQWSYQLDGTLARARKTAADFEPAEHNLGRVAVETVAGMIFVCLADVPPPWAPVRDLVEPYLAGFRFETARIAATSTVIERGNWKLVMENNRECFHCRATHPELCVTFPESPLHSNGGSGEELRALHELVDRCEAMGLPSRFAASADFQYRAMRMPFVGDATSMTIDGRPAVAKRFSGLPAGNVGDVLVYHYPSTWNHFAADHAITFQITPISPTETRLVTTWLVPTDAVEGIDFDLDDLTVVWRATNQQDTALVERTQRGVSSLAYRPGPYSPEEEEGVIQFIDWYTATVTTRLHAAEAHTIARPRHSNQPPEENAVDVAQPRG